MDHRRDGDEELELIGRIAAGDKSAFGRLYALYEKRVYFFIKRRLDDPHESADVFHEVMMDVWRQAGRFEGRSKVATWILGIAHNKSIDVLRKRGRREWDELDETIPDDGPTAEGLLEAAGDARVVRRCMEELKPPAREAIRLAFFESLKYREIAEVMACAEGSIKARIHRAMKQLEACVRRCGLAPNEEVAE